MYTKSLYSNKIDNELNPLCVIEDRKNVWSFRANEKKRSDLALFTQIRKLNDFLARLFGGHGPVAFPVALALC